MRESLDAAAVRLWCAEGLAALRRHQREIDELNVFPIPDGDTGTNLVLTFISASEALDALAAEPDDGGLDDGGPDDAGSDDGASGDGGSDGGPEVDGPGDRGTGGAGSGAAVTGLGRALRCMARGALLGARGNSGVIVSQLLRGIADTLAGQRRARGRALAAALRRAADSGYAAVDEPVEGTVLSVAAAAASAAVAADSDDLAEVVRAASRAAVEALARTPDQLEVLARAGVVDAGGRGLVVLLDALQAVVTGTAPLAPPGTAPPAPPGTASEVRPGTVFEAPPAPVCDPGRAGRPPAGASGVDHYEVQYLLDASADAVDVLRRRLARLGDSLVVVGAEGVDGGVPVWNVHLHTDQVGAAIEAGVEAGRPHRISVTRFADDTGRPGPGGEVALPVRRPDVGAGGRAVVAVAAGPGLAALLESEGAVVVARPVDAGPSTAELLAAIRGVSAGEVVVLPNDANALAVADAAAAEARTQGRTVAVVHTRSPVQGLAAVAVADPGRPFAEDVVAMAEAAAATRWAEVTVAARDALTVAGTCRAGDVLGLCEGEVVAIGAGVDAVAVGLLDRLLDDGGELVTVVTGRDASGGLADALRGHVAGSWPFVECHVVDGGQPHYPVLLGVE